MQAKLNETLDSFGYERFEEQRVFHREMTKSILRHLFRDDLDDHLDALMREFKCKVFSRWGSAPQPPLRGARSRVLSEVVSNAGGSGAARPR